MKRKVKIGDKVKIVSTRGRWWNSSGEMDCFFGKICTVTNISGTSFSVDNTRWFFCEKDIECFVSDEVGTVLDSGCIVEFRNGFYAKCIYFKSGEKKLLNPKLLIDFDSIATRDLFESGNCSVNREFDIIKVFKPVTQTAMLISPNEFVRSSEFELVYERNAVYNPLEITVSEIKEMFGCEEFIILED